MISRILTRRASARLRLRVPLSTRALHVLAWGAGDGGAMGNGELSLSPTAPHSTGLLGKSIAAGHGFSVVIDENGRDLHVSGVNGRGALGVGHTNVVEQWTRVPMPVLDSNDALTRVAAGAFHTLLLSENGHVFSCGSNNFGQCGLSQSRRTLTEFTRVPLTSPIKQIVCGYDHSVLLDTHNQIWTSGWNADGQLGRKTECSSTLFAPVDQSHFNGEIPIGLHSSADTTLIVTESGKLFSFGNTEHFQTMIQCDSAQISVPTKVSFFASEQPKSIVSAVSGQSFAMAQTDSNELFSCGNGPIGHLQSEPRPIYPPQQITNNPLAACESSSCVRLFGGPFAVFAVCGETSDVFAVGRAGKGRLVVSDRDVFTFEQVDELSGKGIVDISVGLGHCLALSDSQEQ